jgi:hypothetical protein
MEREIVVQVGGKEVNNAYKLFRIGGTALEVVQRDEDPNLQLLVDGLFHRLSVSLQGYVIPFTEEIEHYLGPKYGELVRTAITDTNTSVTVPLEHVTIYRGWAFLRAEDEVGNQRIPLEINSSLWYEGFISAAEKFVSYLPDFERRLDQLKNSAIHSVGQDNEVERLMDLIKPENEKPKNIRQIMDTIESISSKLEADGFIPSEPDRRDYGVDLKVGEYKSSNNYRKVIGITLTSVTISFAVVFASKKLNQYFKNQGK